MPVRLTRLRPAPTGAAPVRVGQVVAGQIAVIPVLATGAHPAAVTLALTVAAAVAVRVRGRWLYQWLVTGLAYGVRRTVRRSQVPADASIATVLSRLRPGTRITAATVAEQDAGVLVDPYGVTVLLEVEPADGSNLALPTDSEVDLRVVVQVWRGAEVTHPPARDYRRLAGGVRALAQRVVVAVRAPGSGPLPEVAAGSLTHGVHRVRRALAPRSASLLDPAGLTAALADLGCRAPLQERWSEVVAGGTGQVCYRAGAAAGTLPPKVVPAGPGELLTAAAGTEGGWWIRRPGPVPAQVDGLVRVNGQHLTGLRATLPLPAATTHPRRHAGPLRVPLTPYGVLLGRDPEGTPVAAPLPRAKPVRVAVRGENAARILVWRALGAGLPVVLHTRWPARWQPLVRAAAPAPLTLAPVSEVPEPALHLLDGDAPAPAVAPGSVLATLLRELTASARDHLTGADVVLTGPLPDAEATLLRAALGLGTAGAALWQPTGALAMINRGQLTWLDPALPAEWLADPVPATA